METNPKKREWVKNAAIIVLAALLILTFFSNTIMNRNLPEVSTQYVSDGSINAKVRGSGTVTANGNHQVKAEQTREMPFTPNTMTSRTMRVRMAPTTYCERP